MQVLETGVIPLFGVILTGEYVYCTLLIIQGHIQGHNFNFKVKFAKI